MNAREIGYVARRVVGDYGLAFGAQSGQDMRTVVGSVFGPDGKDVFTGKLDECNAWLNEKVGQAIIDAMNARQSEAA